MYAPQTLVSPQLRGKKINQVRERAIRKLSGIAILMGMVVLACGMVWNLPPANASSHREAPLISADPLADNTDLYAFVSPDKPDTVTIIANWIPFEEPAGGPNFNSFGDDVRYEIYVDNNGDAKADIGYWFRFTTHVRNPNTFLYNVGPIKSLDDPNWNVYQTYTITRVTPTGSTVIGENLATPPVNIGPKSTPNYDALAAAAVHTLSTGAKVFAGQRDDPFFVDLGSVFDLLTIRKLPGNQGGGKDDLKGYNCHTIALQIPINLLTKDGSMPKEPKDGAAVIGVWTTSSRKELKVLNAPGEPPTTEGDWVQVSRLGMPLVNEVVVPLGAKDLWNASKPEDDAQFLAGVTDPEPARLLKLLYNINVPPTPRDDLVAIFLTGIPGLTQPPNVKPSEQLRLNVAIPPSAKPHPLGVVGGDLAGFPNGRRLADDTTDIELKAVAGAVYPLFHPDFKADPVAGLLGDGVDGNDLPFLSSFPYVGSPHQGLEHAHDPTQMNYHFLAVSSAGTIDGVNHLIVMDGNGKFNVGLSQIDGGGSFLHFDGASKVPQTALGYGTWRPKRLVSYNQIGMWGPVGAGILEVEIELIPEFSASSPTLSVIPATLKVICNIGAAGISTGLDEGFILSIPDAKLEFKPLTPHLGLTAFIAGVEEGEARGQTNFHFLARSKAATIEGVDHRVLMSGNGKITPSQVVGGGTFVHFDQASKVPKKIIGAGTWKAKRLISFKPIGTAGPYTAGTVEMEIDIFAVSGTNVSAPTVIPATLKVNCNLDPAGITTGQPEGFTVNVPSVKLEFKPIEPADGLTVFSKGPVEEADNVFFLQLDAGLNMISLPLQPAKAHTAKSLIRELGATIAIELDSKRQSFRGFTASDAGDGFPIEGGKGYIVNVPKSKVVTFVGSPWRNTPPVEAAPPSDAPANTWAFILATNVEALQVEDSRDGGDPRFPELGDMTLTVHNPRTGRVETMAYTEMPGTLHAVWADLSRRSVVEADDVLEIQVRDGARLVGVMRHAITPDEVTRAFAQLRLTPQDLLPTKTLLLANYPNPFNPETWVPYQLAKDTNVSIRIYDSAGRSVRTLNLGYKAAGYYLDKSRAAYWDGRNDVGERMASGVYFYQLVTKDASATRKLVIMK